MEAELLRFPHKQIRADIIKDYMREAGFTKAVCFSCGNAARALEAAGVDTVHVGADGELNPNKWFTQARISKVFDGYFDATSGHLPIELLLRLAAAYKKHLQDKLGDVVYVPTGSGETLVCLKLAYPNKKFIAVYDLDKATEYSKDAPLNKFVELLAAVIYRAKEITPVDS